VSSHSCEEGDNSFSDESDMPHPAESKRRRVTASEGVNDGSVSQFEEGDTTGTPAGDTNDGDASDYENDPVVDDSGGVVRQGMYTDK
jgi:hypothetical protein